MLSSGKTTMPRHLDGISAAKTRTRFAWSVRSNLECSRNIDYSIVFGRPDFAEAGPALFGCCATGAERRGKATMDRDFVLRLAQRVREMILCARTDIAKEQLRVWADEFEATTTELEQAGPDKRQVSSLTEQECRRKPRRMRRLRVRFYNRAGARP